MNLITVEKLSAFYENNEIFKELSFNVLNDDYLYVVGENGSGKTTLMCCILGFKVKHTGTVLFSGLKRNEIGYLPQRTDTESDFPASVTEVVTSGFSGRKFLGLPFSKKAKAEALQNMKSLGISELKDRSFKELSGGQQQKVLLCRALCTKSKILLLDEPVTGLDETAREEMYSIIKRLNDNGTAVIMISHDMDAALKYSKHILHLSENGYFYGDVMQYKKSGLLKTEIKEENQNELF